MSMNIKKLIEELNGLMENDIPEEVMQDEMDLQGEDTIEPKIVEPETEKTEIVDTMELAKVFDAKSKIALALENLQTAVNEFKDATAEKVNLIKDNLLLQEIEGLDVAIEGIKNSLASGELLNDTQLNDPFNAEHPDIDVQPQEPDKDLQDMDTADEQEADDEDADEDEDEIKDFDNLAGLNLFDKEENAGEHSEE